MQAEPKGEKWNASAGGVCVGNEMPFFRAKSQEGRRVSVRLRLNLADSAQGKFFSRCWCHVNSDGDKSNSGQRHH